MFESDSVNIKSVLSINVLRISGVGVTKPIFSVPLFSLFFPNDQNSGYLYDIKFIFGRCHRSWAAETPGKYEHDWNYLTYAFAKSKFPVTEKLANGALVTPIPVPLLLLHTVCISLRWGLDEIASNLKISTRTKLYFRAFQHCTERISLCNFMSTFQLILNFHSLNHEFKCLIQPSVYWHSCVFLNIFISRMLKNIAQ